MLPVYDLIPYPATILASTTIIYFSQVTGIIPASIPHILSPAAGMVI